MSDWCVSAAISTYPLSLSAPAHLTLSRFARFLGWALYAERLLLLLRFRGITRRTHGRTGALWRMTRALLHPVRRILAAIGLAQFQLLSSHTLDIRSRCFISCSFSSLPLFLRATAHLPPPPTLPRANAEKWIVLFRRLSMPRRNCFFIDDDTRSQGKSATREGCCF